jgi:hypothetical protein
MRWPRPRHSRAAAYRYLDEVIAVLADEAPDLREALQRARDVILDGTVIPADRCKEQALSVKGEDIDLVADHLRHHVGVRGIRSLQP